VPRKKKEIENTTSEATDVITSENTVVTTPETDVLELNVEIVDVDNDNTVVSLEEEVKKKKSRSKKKKAEVVEEPVVEVVETVATEIVPNNFHVGVADDGIYVGNMNSDSTDWLDATEDTNEVISALRDYFEMLSNDRVPREYETFWASVNYGDINVPCKHLMYYEGDESYFQKVERLEKLIDNLNSHNSLLASERDYFSEKVEELQESINRLEQEKNMLFDEKNMLFDEKNRLFDEKNSFSADNERLSAELATIKIQFEELRSENANNLNRLNNVMADFDGNQRIINDLNRQLAEEKEIKDWYASLLYKYTKIYKIFKDTLDKTDLPMYNNVIDKENKKEES